MDTDSETSEYTNSVDIWSLGCVIYELLVGARLFVSEAQISLYYFGKCRFPEDRLKELALPITDVGISLLKSMLTIQPEDRLTVVGALSHEWFGNKNSRDDHDGTIQNRDRSTIRRKRENTTATDDRPKRRREGNPITRGDTRCISGGAAIEAGAGWHSNDNHTTRVPGNP